MKPEYTELLKRIKTQFATIAGTNFSFTPAIVKLAHGRKCEVYFAYGISSKEKILRPYIRLVTDFENGLFLEFKNAYYSDFADDKKYPLNMEFNAKVPVAKSVKEQQALIKNLQTLYTKVRTFAFSKDLSTEDKNTLANYTECLSKTIPADLLNFCKNTEPEFFRWLSSSLR